jgi:putative heme-binding domain-containing protein
VHALGVLDGLDRLTSAEVVKAMTAKHSRVRRAALQYAERPRFAYRDVGQELRVCAADDDPQVRLQAVFTAGSCTTREAGSLLADVLAADQDNPFIVAAALSSVSKSNATEFLGSLGKHRGLSAPLLAKLFRVAQGYGATSAMGRLVMNHFVAAPDQPLSSEHLYHLADFFDAMGGSVEPFLKSLRQQDANAALRFFARLHAETKRIVRDPKTPLGDRVLALQLLGRGLGDDGEDCNLLQEQLAPQYPEDVHLAAVQQFGAMTDLRVPSRLTANWKSYSPSLRTRVIDTLLARGEWTRSLMELIESKKILPAEIDTIRRQTLLDHRDAAVRKAAARIFAASSDPDRAKLVSRYWIALPPQGDIARGSKHFAKHCAACHQLGGIGQQVGPELASVGDKSPEGLLSAILDPNRAVEARYVNYIAATSAGVTVSGLLQGETSTTITLIAADGKKHDLLRRDIEELTSTGKSVMPEGFEKELPPADMADLIAFLRGHLAKPKVFAGNRPDTAKAGADGVLRLTAANAAIFGKTLVFEEKHQNLGYWSSSDDHAVWTVEVPKDGRYEVWLDFACDPSAAGNTLALQAADARLTHQVRSTASWGLYRQAKVGVIRLPAGRHEIIVRPEGAIRLALIDLKAIELRPAE